MQLPGVRLYVPSSDSSTSRARLHGWLLSVLRAPRTSRQDQFGGKPGARAQLQMRVASC